MGHLQWLIVGTVVGAILALAVVFMLRHARRKLSQQFTDESAKEKVAEIDAMMTELRTAFAALSRDALSHNSDDFLKLAQTKLTQESVRADESLEGKKKLIDVRLEEMNTKLQQLNTVIQGIEKQRSEAQGLLTGHLERSTQATNRLHETTGQLREALASPNRRGQWGERMAEDVLKLAGLVEGINYSRHERAGNGTFPDFTFPLPGERKVHMDVKFPIVNYLKVCDAADEPGRMAATAEFLKNVRQHIKAVTTREYINPGDGTVDYVLLFIPNEQIYGFIHDHDRSLMDDALQSKVALCSPTTLYAILALMRQAAETVCLEQRSAQILEILTHVRAQWNKYVDSMRLLGDKLEAATKEYQNLTTTRSRQLDRQFDQIDQVPVDVIQAPDKTTVNRVIEPSNLI